MTTTTTDKDLDLQNPRPAPPDVAYIDELLGALQRAIHALGNDRDHLRIELQREARAHVREVAPETIERRTDAEWFSV